jgi:hypothetical protein
MHLSSSTQLVPRWVRETAAYTRFLVTATVLLTFPPSGRADFQTSSPSSALIANTQPRLVATYTQP